MSLVSCLPALEDVNLSLPELLVPKELDRLLEALAWLPRLRVLDLTMDDDDADAVLDDKASRPCPDTSAFAKLRSLTKLALSFGEADSYTAAGVVDALVSLSGLADLRLWLPQSSVMPAALRQLKGLRSLVLSNIHLGDFEADCLVLPNLLNLVFVDCHFGNADMLPGVTALQNLTSIKFLRSQGPRFFDQQLVRLPRLQRIIFDMCEGSLACPWLSRLPADMGSLSSTLLHLCCCGAGLTQLPLALTQLVALEHLDASKNSIVALPAAITALSRLTELVLGRACGRDLSGFMHGRPLDVRALGDLSGFPALRKLRFSFSEVMLCESMLGAVRHTSLTGIEFFASHPAPECAPTVLQLNQALRRLSRGGVLRFVYCEQENRHGEQPLQAALALPPQHKFQVALQACGM